jgi:NhaA family Na+:H+ antiporter
MVRWLDRAVDPACDHLRGLDRADLTLVEYGSYACPYCRAANDEIATLRDRFGNRLRYCFRQRPLTGSEIAKRAAELAESAADEETFWGAHVELMTRSPALSEEDMCAVAQDFGLPGRGSEGAVRARARVEADVASAHRSGVQFTPTFFINARRYDGPWDETTLAEEMLGSLGHRVHSVALDFASWAPATGLLLLVTTVLAVVLVNLPGCEGFVAFWETPLGLAFGGTAFGMPLQHWINDALLMVFFLLVGLEIKRELTVGRLATWRLAAWPCRLRSSPS